jgi:outer membrane receptor for ferrienterochelin and colicin
VIIQGLESTITARLERVVGMDMSLSFTYVYIYARNEDDSSVTMGEAIEHTPEHQFIAQIVCEFKTSTSLVVWGQHTRNQIVYVMREAPPAGTGLTYTNDYYKTADLHNPIFLNAKISQHIIGNFDIYIMCKNILDDYRADPFNPGPGRMFYFGGNARL